MISKRGFTIIEILVVIAVIGILGGLVLSAVQAAREGSRLANCANNLRQIGLAMQSYAARENVFPSAMSKQKGRFGQAFSPFMRILPELEQQSLFNAINVDINQTQFSVASENDTAASIRVRVFVCPSDDGVLSLSSSGSSYRANMGSSMLLFPEQFEPLRSGPFILEKWVRPSDISDGLSSTALISERLVGDGDPGSWDKRRDPWFAGLQPLVATTDAAVSRCATVPSVVPPHFSAGGANWLLFGYDTTWYNHVMSPNGIYPDCATAKPEYGLRGGSDSGVYCARSNHSACVNMATADGAVHRVRDGISVETWRSLGTRAGGETFTSPY